MGKWQYKTPTGSIGELYRQVATYYDGPPESEIERIANQAVVKDSISDKSYVVMIYRLPYQGIKRKTLEEVGALLDGVSKERVRHLEDRLYKKLQDYLPEEIRNSNYKQYGKKTRGPPIEPMLTVGEVSRLLGVHKNTVRRWSDRGILHAIIISVRGDRRFMKKYINRYLEESKIN